MTNRLGGNLEWVAGSRQTGEIIGGVYKKIDMCVNLEWVAGCRWTGEGRDGLARVGMENLKMLGFKCHFKECKAC